MPLRVGRDVLQRPLHHVPGDEHASPTHAGAALGQHLGGLSVLHGNPYFVEQPEGCLLNLSKLVL